MAYEDRVELGAKLLDERRPDWAVEVRGRRLRMDDGERCILGQLYGVFREGLVALYGDDVPGFERYGLAIQHGFTLKDEERSPGLWTRWRVNRRFGLLAAAWRKEIRRRLAS